MYSDIKYSYRLFDLLLRCGHNCQFLESLIVNFKIFVFKFAISKLKIANGHFYCFEMISGAFPGHSFGSENFLIVNLSISLT